MFFLTFTFYIILMRGIEINSANQTIFPRILKLFENLENNFNPDYGKVSSENASRFIENNKEPLVLLKEKVSQRMGRFLGRLAFLVGLGNNELLPTRASPYVKESQSTSQMRWSPYFAAVYEPFPFYSQPLAMPFGLFSFLGTTKKPLNVKSTEDNQHKFQVNRIMNDDHKLVNKEVIRDNYKLNNKKSFENINVLFNDEEKKEIIDKDIEILTNRTEKQNSTFNDVKDQLIFGSNDGTTTITTTTKRFTTTKRSTIPYRPITTYESITTHGPITTLGIPHINTNLGPQEYTTIHENTITNTNMVNEFERSTTINANNSDILPTNEYLSTSITTLKPTNTPETTMTHFGNTEITTYHANNENTTVSSVNNTVSPNVTHTENPEFKGYYGGHPQTIEHLYFTTNTNYQDYNELNPQLYTNDEKIEDFNNAYENFNNGEVELYQPLEQNTPNFHNEAFQDYYQKVGANFIPLNVDVNGFKPNYIS